MLWLDQMCFCSFWRDNKNWQSFEQLIEVKTEPPKRRLSLPHAGETAPMRPVLEAFAYFHLHVSFFECCAQVVSECEHSGTLGGRRCVRAPDPLHRPLTNTRKPATNTLTHILHV